jgi:peptide/nickel transport system substrate-binding protein
MGSYTVDTLPAFIANKLSRGLTVVDGKGSVKPALAKRWEILDEGKTYVFHLKEDQYLSDGRNITSDLISYNFSDVSVERPDKYKIIYKLKDKYSPFLITVSRPMFQPGLIGAGEYKIDDIALNGNFIQSVTLVGVKDKFDVKTYEFYPSVEALKYAYALGDITEAVGLDDIIFQNMTYDKFINTKVNRKVNYKKLVTLFYNNNDSVVSDKRIRLGLSYALPNKYPGREKAFLPYSPGSIYYNQDLEDKEQNFEHAKLLLEAATRASDSAEVSSKLKLTITTLPKYKKLANDIAKNFARVNVDTTIEEVDRVPANFQLYLGDFTLSDDPDQYPLWHSGQITNITKYKNLRIDKLLEDGRNTVDVNARKIIYADFQRFLIEDVPASFLYFPVEYEIARK